MIVTAFDTETTALIYNRTVADKHLPYIVDFYAAAVDLESGEILGEYETLVKPPIPLSEETTNITRLTDEHLKDAPAWKDVMELALAALENATIVLAHNAAFDKEMVEIECARAKRTVRWPPILCSIEATMHLKGYRLSMSALYELLFNMKFADAHRARPDTMALIRCAVELYRRGEL
jgi:DNA polymerase III epsilon subunit-like protein